MFNDISTGGRWSPDEKLVHLNILEIKALKFGLLSFFRDIHDAPIRVRTDNSTAVAYINNMVGI